MDLIFENEYLHLLKNNTPYFNSNINNNNNNNNAHPKKKIQNSNNVGTKITKNKNFKLNKSGANNMDISGDTKVSIIKKNKNTKIPKIEDEKIVNLWEKN